MAWIESHQALLTHRKTGRLARALDISKVTAIGHLHAFWWWCMDNAPLGDLTGIDAEDIADGACWEASAGQFLDALIFAGFVDREDEQMRVHDWMDFAGKLIVRRISDAERKRSERQKLPVRKTSTGRRKDGVRTQPNPTVHNTTQPEETPPTPAPGEATKVAAVPNAPYRLFARFCEEAEVEEGSVAPTERGKQLGIAKAILAEHSEDEAMACAAYLHSQAWRTGLIDLGTVKAEIGRWKMAGSPTQERARAPTNGQRPVTFERAKSDTNEDEFAKVRTFVQGSGDRNGVPAVRDRNAPSRGIVPR